MKTISLLKTILNITIVLLIGILTILFTALYLETFTGGFFYNYKRIILFSVTALVCVLGVLSMIFSSLNSAFIYKLTVLSLSLFAIILASLYFLKISGILDKIDSVNDLRNYIASFSSSAVIIYIVLNVLQVVVLPIPGFIAVLTGVALFGPLKAVIYSFIGIIIGSLIAFFIGRHLGYKVVCWLVGEDVLKKWLNSVKRKDKIVLTFMFLFPFFPDDVLCFVAGLSTISTIYFIVMIVICRIISITTTAYSINGSIIPYNTWWGITLWAVIFIVTVILAYLIYKYGDKIEKNIKQKFKRFKK